MDINDELLTRSDFDFDFGKSENINGLMPVAFIDYESPDGNNNILGTGPNGHIKSFLDEMLLTDSLASGDALQLSGANSFELLGTFQWTPGEGGESDNALSSTNANVKYDIDQDHCVTTLTNLLDPLFVTYGEDVPIGNGKIDQYLTTTTAGTGEGGSGGDDSPTSAVVSSSDLISTTFLNGEINENGDLIATWHGHGHGHGQKNSSNNTNSNNSGVSSISENSVLFCDDSLLRSALQAGNLSQALNGKSALILKPSSGTSLGEMTELRKLLHPHSSGPSSSSSSSSPGDSSSTTTTIITTASSPSPSSHSPNNFSSYELKVYADPIFTSAVIDDSNIPNVEELIMTKIQPLCKPNSNNHNHIGQDIISEKKINSTTLSTKWTYTLAPDNKGKKGRGLTKRNGIIKNERGNGGDNIITISQQTLSVNGLSQSSLVNGNVNGSSSSSASTTSRKERSLHYCNICCKGFKDKYSVNVHVRTHTGEKPFACSLCGKNFRQKAHLAKHYSTHANSIGKKKLKN